mgnify:CR=1 FL=1
MRVQANRTDLHHRLERKKIKELEQQVVIGCPWEETWSGLFMKHWSFRSLNFPESGLGFGWRQREIGVYVVERPMEV